MPNTINGIEPGGAQEIDLIGEGFIVVKLLLVLSDPSDLFVAEMTLAAGEFEPVVPVQLSNAQDGALGLVAQDEEPPGRIAS